MQETLHFEKFVVVSIRLSSMIAGIRWLILEAYFESSRTSTMELFCKNSERSLAANYFRKKALLKIIDWVLNQPLNTIRSFFPNVSKVKLMIFNFFFNDYVFLPLLVWLGSKYAPAFPPKRILIWKLWITISRLISNDKTFLRPRLSKNL